MDAQELANLDANLEDLGALLVSHAVWYITEDQGFQGFPDLLDAEGDPKVKDFPYGLTPLQIQQVINSAILPLDVIASLLPLAGEITNKSLEV